MPSSSYRARAFTRGSDFNAGFFAAAIVAVTIAVAASIALPRVAASVHGYIVQLRTASPSR
ncbi:hypothetical protein [Opitutus sp. ER46]|uniref:hypothetical protein n=1 Tax=Opitutus sp. ER46 TaxID=2161864 RepID=UPI000D2FA8A0|nr:hypothetical protein [Opitutus sp. ER46]PTX98903.1 hypothetical protein DB354_02435 [Opitutus sp. ER46]